MLKVFKFCIILLLYQSSSSVLMNLRKCLLTFSPFHKAKWKDHKGMIASSENHFNGLDFPFEKEIDSDMIFFFFLLRN